jgi:hypothetical protein
MAKYRYPKIGETWRERTCIMDKEVPPTMYVTRVDRVHKTVHFSLTKKDEDSRLYCKVEDMESFFVRVNP